jgi:hypothetical protein
MIILTGCWFLPIPPGHIKVGISRGRPRGLPTGYRMYRALAPGPWFNSVGAAEYTRLYETEILGPLDPAQVLDEIAKRAAGLVPVLCCYERLGGPGWCHRSLAAEWLGAHLGRTVPELGFEGLAQDEHPMLPTQATWLGV